MQKLLLCAIVLAFSQPAAAQNLVLAGEVYPPYSYLDNSGRPDGMYMDQIKLITARAGIEFEASIMPWARAIALAETMPMHCAYATARTEEREHRFRWVEPLHTDRNVLVTTDDSGIPASTLEQVKQHTVGTQRNDYTESLLKQQGFSRIDISADFNNTLKKLVSGRIDMMPMSESTFRRLRSSDSSFRQVAILDERRLGLACNLAVPASMIDALQRQLDILISDGTQRSLYIKHGLIIREGSIPQLAR